MNLLKIPGRDLLVSLIHTANEMIPGKDPSPVNRKHVKIIAHRGTAGRRHPENTITSFRNAIDLGVHGIELDLHLTADEQVVIQHDHNLKRIFGSNHVINDLSLAQLKKQAAELPTLSELLDYAPSGLMLILEVKKQTRPELDIKLASQLIRQLEKDTHPVLIITLHPELLLNYPVSDRYKRIPIFPRFNEPQIEWVLENQMNGIFGYYWFFSLELVNRLRSEKLISGCGIINGPNLGRRFINRGLDILFTDRADLLMPLVN